MSGMMMTPIEHHSRFGGMHEARPFGGLSCFWSPSTRKSVASQRPCCPDAYTRVNKPSRNAGPKPVKSPLTNHPFTGRQTAFHQLCNSRAIMLPYLRTMVWIAVFALIFAALFAFLVIITTQAGLGSKAVGRLLTTTAAHNKGPTAVGQLIVTIHSPCHATVRTPVLWALNR
jgi:hypothetical protein